MNIDNIVVSIFKINVNSTESLNIAPFLNNDDYDNATIAYTVHQRMKPRDIIYLYKFQGPESDIVRDFKKELSFFLESKPRTILDYAFFLDIFCPIRPEPTILSLDYKPVGHKVVDDILAPTRNLLIWNSQLEAILSLFYESESKVLDMRIGLNIRDVLVENRAKKLMLTENISVFDVFTERVINFTGLPNIKGAYRLYAVLQKEWIV